MTTIPIIDLGVSLDVFFGIGTTCKQAFYTSSTMQVDPEKPVLVAGDPERRHEEQVASDGGIWYHNNLIDVLVSLFSRIIIIIISASLNYVQQNKLAERLKVEPIKLKSQQ